ncbi:retrovirus-related pol polyprotein from transposon TNT 1-94 [Tanacetum coccineum]
MKVKESFNVTLDESPPPTKLSPLADDDVGEEEAIRKNTKIANTNNEEYESIEVDEIVNIKESKNHPLDQVDDIIFGSTCQNLCDDFEKIMHDEFEMSMMGELNFFLGLQIKQMEDEIFFNQSKYIKEMLKKFGFEDSKPTKTSMSTEIKLTKYD